jgi:hypothetical protein
MIIREDLVKLSVLRKLKESLPEYGYVYPPAAKANLLVRDAFPTPEERTAELVINTLAFGFNIDDGGREMELGSTLTEYKHTLVAWVFGMEYRIAEQVANSIKHIMRKSDDIVPLLNFAEEGDPQIDVLRIDKVQTQHQGNNSQRPWDQYVFTTSMVVCDAYYI